MKLMLACIVIAVAVVRPLVAGNDVRQPKGVVLVLIDDIGYGDFNALTPGSVKTPQMDKLYGESIRLTDFHVGTTCSPTRGSLMTGRNVNAGGVWHTISGRSLLRENEQTMAELFKANGWVTGIFGKWHLGDTYPFLPRHRGFDVEVIHGGGGVGQTPDYWGNNYYADVDYEGNPTTPDVYHLNGKPVTADKFCTDFWFDRAAKFMSEALQNNKPFFAYIPLNAAHGPCHAPNGYSKGFDGLIENIDDNMGRLDNLLSKLGIKDDVLLILTTDNGTAGPRGGGLRGKKGSYYDGGHNVPCFIRWKNGSIAGSPDKARDIHALTAAMDFFPTFMDLFNLKRPAGGRPLDGISLKKMMLAPGFSPSARTIIVDTQRDASLLKWKNTSIMYDEVKDGKIIHKWRLLRSRADKPFELYDLLSDRAQENNLAAHAGSADGLVKKLVPEYERWWSDISQNCEPYPPSVINPDKETEAVLTSHDWIDSGMTPWNQGSIRNGEKGSGKSAIRFDKAGRYRFELRRWPREAGAAIDGKPRQGKGIALPVTKASIMLKGVGTLSKDVASGAESVVIEMNVPAGPQTVLQTSFMNAEGNVLTGAYYVYIKAVR